MEYFDSSYFLLVIGILAMVAECLLVVPKKLNLFLVGIVLIITGAIGILLHSFIIALITALAVLFNLHFIFRVIYSPDSKNNNKPFIKKKLPLALSSIINKVPFTYRIFLLAILASIFFLRGGFFNPEAYYFLRQFQEDKPFLIRIFDNALEFNNPFQAREFSYIIDFIDGQFLIRSARLGIVHFYQLSHYVGIFMIASLAFIMSKRYFKQKFLDISILISLLYLTTPPVFINGNLYRSSKILVAFFIVFIMYVLFNYATKKIISKKHLLLFTIFAFLMATSDKQGIFFVSAFAAALGIIFLLDRTWKSFLPIICFVIAGMAYAFYSSTVGPWLIYFFNNESVQFTKDSDLLLNYLPAVNSYRIQVIEYFSYQFSYFFGNLGIFFGAFVAIVMFLSFLYLFVRIGFKEYGRGNYYNTALVGKLTLVIPIILLLSAIFIAMMLHYSILFLTAPDLRLTYYNLPIIALILLLSQIVFARFLIIWPDKKKLIKGVLIVFLVLNVISILKHFDVYKEGFIKQGALAAPVLKECIKQKDEPQKNFGLLGILQHADSACTFLRKRIESDHVLCRDNPSYKCLSKIDEEEFEKLKSEQAQKSKPSEILSNPSRNNLAFILLRNNLQNKNYLGDTEIKLNNSVYYISMSSISPDNFLYKVIIVRDKIVEGLLVGQINKIKYELLMANRLIYSSLLLADKGNISLAKEFALKGENHFTILTYYWYGDNIPKELVKEVKDSAIMHRAILTEILGKAKKEEDKAVFKQVFDFSVRNEKQLDVFMKKNKST